MKNLDSYFHSHITVSTAKIKWFSTGQRGNAADAFLVHYNVVAFKYVSVCVDVAGLFPIRGQVTPVVNHN